MSSTRITGPWSRESPSVCGLQSLPRELRDPIYSHLLRGRYINLLEGASSAENLKRLSKASQLNILRASRQTSKETTSVLYSENSFHLIIHDPLQIKLMRRMLNRQPQVQSEHPITPQIQCLIVHIFLDNCYFKKELPQVSGLPLNQLRKLGNSGFRSERCDVKLNYCWWRGCCSFYLRYPPRETIKLLSKLSIFRMVTIELKPEKHGFGNHSDDFLEVIRFPYPTLEKKLRAVLGPGQLETFGDCQRLVFVPPGKAPAKVQRSADFAVRNMGGHNVWSSLSDPAEGSEVWG